MDIPLYSGVVTYCRAVGASQSACLFSLGGQYRSSHAKLQNKVPGGLLQVLIRHSGLFLDFHLRLLSQ
jgi:hypothetical protein